MLSELALLGVLMVVPSLQGRVVAWEPVVDIDEPAPELWTLTLSRCNGKPSVKVLIGKEALAKVVRASQLDAACIRVGHLETKRAVTHYRAKDIKVLRPEECGCD